MKNFSRISGGGAVTFTSGDSTSATLFTSVDTLSTDSTLSSLFNKISTMFKNIRYLYSMVTTLNSDLSNLTRVSETTVTTGYFNSPISFRRVGNVVYVRMNATPGWSFSASRLFIANFPSGYAPTYDSDSVLYESAVPVGTIYAIKNSSTGENGLYIAGRASKDGLYYSFHFSYISI